MILLCLLKKLARGNIFNLVRAVRMNKLTRCIPLWKTTRAEMPAALSEYCIYVYGASRYILFDKGKQFVANFFYFLCGKQRSKPYLIAAYHPQKNEQTKGSSKKILPRLRHYVTDHRADGYQYLLPLAYSYSPQFH